MAKRYSIALHDLKVSSPDAVAVLARLGSFLGRPFTLHLVCDEPLHGNAGLAAYIRACVAEGTLDVVYHGVHHRCEKKGWRLLYWYHHYEAEYIIDSEELRRRTAEGYAELSGILGKNPGICPPCWIASKKNIRFLESLEPLYREELLHLVKGGKRFFSSVVSLGSPRAQDLVFLKAIARTSCRLSSLLGIARVRVAVHICDLSLEKSMDLFRKSIASLESRGYENVQQRDLSQ